MLFGRLPDLQVGAMVAALAAETGADVRSAAAAAPSLDEDG